MGLALLPETDDFVSEASAASDVCLFFVKLMKAELHDFNASPSHFVSVWNITIHI